MGGKTCARVSVLPCVGRSSQPLSRILYPSRRRVAAIYLGRTLPRTSTRPTRSSEGTGHSLSLEGTCPCLALLLVGFAWPRRSPASPVVSYTTISPLPRGAREAVSFLWHSAVRSPRLAVSQHHALWSPDFPRSTQDTVPRGTQLPGQLERSPIIAQVAAKIKLRKAQGM